MPDRGHPFFIENFISNRNKNMSTFDREDFDEILNSILNPVKMVLVCDEEEVLSEAA